MVLPSHVVPFQPQRRAADRETAVRLMQCNSCRKTCVNSYHALICNDNSRLIFCRACWDAWQAFERMIDQRGGQMHIAPPDALDVIAEISQHGGMKFSSDRKYGLQS